ncbi:MAG: DUF4082 domain-containing protein [Acetobacteraceae bacterium]|nr:DUF4082 domain-containing protein [Acetobacteraceae bacterium]
MIEGNSVAFTITRADGSPTIAETVDYSVNGGAAQTLSFAPGDTSKTITVPTTDDGVYGSENADETLFENNTPSNTDTSDASPVELGVKFTSSQPGIITGIRFYKGLQDTGTHTGELWDSSGHQLATATFTNESASGWQQVDFTAIAPI